jgi:hypothetical protein
VGDDVQDLLKDDFGEKIGLYFTVIYLIYYFVIYCQLTALTVGGALQDLLKDYLGEKIGFYFTVIYLIYYFVTYCQLTGVDGVGGAQDLLKDYFGEKIGFYFTFLSHYTTWLIVPSIVGGWQIRPRKHVVP